MNDLQQIAEIPIDHIYQIENARGSARESELSELMTSMKHIGLLQAIGVKAVSKNRFEVVFGNRRFMAAKKLGWSTIAAVMTSAETEEEFLLKNTTENIVRVGVPLSDQGRIFDKLTKLGLTSSEIASRIGISSSVVNVALDMFRQIPKKFQEKIITGNMTGSGGKAKKGLIPMNAARAIRSSMRDFELDKEQVNDLFSLASQDGISVPTIAAVSKLVGQGYEIKQALEATSQLETVRIAVIISKKEIARVEKKYNRGIRAFLYEMIADNSEVKILGQGKTLSIGALKGKEK